ncbi:MAG: heme-binding protein [Dehalococcoidia bacterium]|nr:heme-binding protein [Dehalococcoidia bacterium]MSQ16342.1 heme-binding protein [Dehalococcoidia bacterium]
MPATFQRPSITLEAAQQVINGATRRAMELGVPMATAVVDPDGTLKSFIRMDGAALLAVGIAQRKAWTAISFSTPTHGLWEFIKNDPPLLHSLPQQENMVLFGGGYPIVLSGQMSGGIGVSGGHYSQDQQCAEAGLAALGAG